MQNRVLCSMYLQYGLYALNARATLTGVTIENRGCLLASETLSGITQSRFRYIYLASERSERDTIRGNSIEISLYLFIYLSVYGVRETSVFARASNYVS